MEHNGTKGLTFLKAPIPEHVLLDFYLITYYYLRSDTKCQGQVLDHLFDP